MILKTAERHTDYRSPNAMWTILGYCDIIAESELETVEEGEEWIWDE